MSQSVNLSIAGIYTSLNDFNGLPPGALDVADNIEVRYRNLGEPRRGFDSVLNSAVLSKYFKRLTNFYVVGTNCRIGLTSTGDLLYYNGSAWVAVPGDFSSNLIAPDSVNAKCRFIQAGQNLYVTSQDGIRSLSSGSSAKILRAGIPKGLDLKASVTADTSGFFNNNSVKTTTADVTSGSALLANLGDTTSVALGQYVSGSGIPVGSKVLSITPSATLIVETGDTTVGSTSLGSLASISGITAGVLITGQGIPQGAKVVSTSGAGPYTVVMDSSAFQTNTGISISFDSSVVITLDQNATATNAATSLNFYLGAQVGYRIIFGRVETDINNNTITRLGSPSQIALVTNTGATPTNVSVVATLPKNSINQITFAQLYRSAQTADATVTPLDQYNLVSEVELVSGDFTSRSITITDDVPDSLKGIPLYAGSDQEGVLQSNDPPPMAWDMCRFKNFTLFGNITRPSTLKVTIVSVDSPSGIQTGDTLTVSGSFQGTSFSETYTASSSEDASLREFQVVTSGTPSQNIADTADSLIRVINYDNSVPIHTILLSTATDLPGQIQFESDNPSLDTFTVTSSGHPGAYDPTLTNLVSNVNSIYNGIAVSKDGEQEAVPLTNLLSAGDTSSPLIRMVPQRNYVIVMKGDGVYKIMGTDPSSLVIDSFDLTTRIIGADTAVSLNSSVWMLSNQGVVSISDGGVDAKSPPIDDQLNALVWSNGDNVRDTAFAIAYESDRKYILCLPTSTNTYSDIQYCFNYVTSAWTTWSRNLHAAFIDSIQNKLYIARADGNDQSVSVERKDGSYKDFVDEGIANTITAVSTDSVTLSSLDSVSAGDILFQDDTHFSVISAIGPGNNVSVQPGSPFTTGSVSILKAFLCDIQWKQVFGDNPAFSKQFSEGIFLFKNTDFTQATARFATDFSPNVVDVPLSVPGQSLWGQFPWGQGAWGGEALPSTLRFYIPQDKQMCSYILPSFRIQQGYSGFKLQGLALAFTDVSQEVGI